MTLRSGTVPAIIQHARVLDVDRANWTVSVATEFTKKPLMSLSFATPYTHFNNGEGFNFMPEVGSLCWLCEPSDGSMPFVLAWGPAQVEANFRANRHQLNPGDMMLSTRDENAVILRRGGIVEIRGSALCQRIFFPINNVIKDFCENYHLHTLAGDLEWTIERTVRTVDGHRPARLKLYAKEFADDKDPIARLEVGTPSREIGSHEDGTVLALRIADSKIMVDLTKQGGIKLTVERDVEWSVKGAYKITAQGDIRFKTSANMELEATGKFSAKGATAEIEGTSMVTVKTQLAKIDAPITQAGGMIPVAHAPALISWCVSHVHPYVDTKMAGPTPAMTSPSTTPVPPSLTSQSLFAKPQGS